VAGTVDRWAGQLPVPPGRTHRDIHAPFVPRPSQPPKTAHAGAATAGAALAGSSAGPAWAAQTSLPAVIHLPNGIRPEGIAIGDLDVPTTVAAYGDRLYLPNARFTTTPTPDTPYDVIAVARRRVETAGR
jgi:hypothetical protein